MGISRRDFLKGASVVTGGIAIGVTSLTATGCRVLEQPIIKEVKFDYSKYQPDDALDFLVALKNSEKADYDAFLAEFTDRIDKEDISAIIFGEEHMINAQLEFAVRLLKDTSKNEKIVGFYGEQIEWGNPEYKGMGIFAGPHLKDLGLLTLDETRRVGKQCNSTICLKTDQPAVTHIIGIPYETVHPEDLKEVKKGLEGLSDGELIATYTGRMHSSDLWKGYPISNPQTIDVVTKNWAVAQYPTVESTVRKSGRKSLVVQMNDLDYCLSETINGFLRMVPDSMDEFKLNLTKLMKGIQPDKVYNLDGRYVLVTNDVHYHDGVGYRLADKFKVLDYYTQVMQNPRLRNILESGYYVFVAGDFKRLPKDVTIGDQTGERLPNLTGHVHFRAPGKNLVIYVQNDKISKALIMNDQWKVKDGFYLNR